MSESSPTRFSAWQAATTAAVIWLVTCLGWSWYVLSWTCDATVSQSLLQTARNMAMDLTYRLPEPKLDPDRGYDSWARSDAVTNEAAHHFLADRRYAYLMLWLQ